MFDEGSAFTVHQPLPPERSIKSLNPNQRSNLICEISAESIGSREELMSLYHESLLSHVFNSRRPKSLKQQKSFRPPRSFLLK